MKNRLKVSFVALALLLLIAPFSKRVFANTFTSSLYMATGTSLNGQVYSFDEGTYKISLYPTSFYGFNYCHMYIDLYRKDLVGKTFLAGDDEVMTPTNQTYTYSRGYHKAGKAYYYFQLEHGGIEANPVYLFTE
jgi:sRNA-binding regulator protein Hfq